MCFSASYQEAFERAGVRVLSLAAPGGVGDALRPALVQAQQGTQGGRGHC